MLANTGVDRRRERSAAVDDRPRPRVVACTVESDGSLYRVTDPA